MKTTTDFTNAKVGDKVIDGRFLTIDEIKKLAVNDGFVSPEQMFWWFDNNDFQGQLIHWTDAIY